MMCQILCFRKKKKNVISLASAEFAPSMVCVNTSHISTIL